MTLPYNLSIDAKIEFRITNPYIIYFVGHDFKGDDIAVHSMVSNDTQLIINEAILKNKNLCYDTIQKKIDEIVNDKYKNTETIFGKLNKGIKKFEDLKNPYKIERIIITTFDNTISIKHVD